MTNPRDFVAVAAAVLMLSSIGAARAEESPPEAIPARAERHHSINLGVGALAGATSLSYEYRWTRGHGLVLELNHLYLPANDAGRVGVGGVVGLVLEASDPTRRGRWASSGLGAAVGYRWHWSRQQSSGFYGLHAGVDLGRSLDSSEANYINHTTLYVAGNIGRRWLLGNGFQITARIGAGYALRTSLRDYEEEYTWSVRPMDELVAPRPLTLDGELSVGYAF